MPGPMFYNTCWMAACFREARAYHRAASHARKVQADVLRQVVGKNRDTWFGRSHDFASIRDVRSFQDAVPLSTYDDYRATVERIARGEQHVLTSDRVELLEPTGGTTAGEKLIPYTAALRRGFQRAIRVWIWDLFSSRPAVRRGSAYWSISPIMSARRSTAAGIPIGFQDDAAYFGTFEKRLVQRTMAVPPDVAMCPSIESSRYTTLFFLLRDARLALISVWSPTFLTEMLKSLWAHREGLCDDIESGSISNIDGIRSPAAEGRYTPRSKRADELRQILDESAGISGCLQAIWPRLGVVSCWADGPSSTYANNLRHYLRDIEVQPKGLLATEAFVSVPLISQPAPSLAIRSHFFEFLPADPTNRSDPKPLLADELEPGRQYRVVVTTQGGLYRYQLHDQIEVVGFHRATPLLRFVGKTDATSDLVGEKLSAAHAESALRAAFAELQLTPRFAQLTAERERPGYVLQLLDDSLASRPDATARLCGIVETRLAANPAYRYARQLEQLSPLRIELLVEAQADRMVANYLNAELVAGRRLGDIKACTLRYNEAANGAAISPVESP